MDISALQVTLRRFAAERDWQPFHTPKNLATALMVEAAELAEIFQWMTPEQSLAAHGDAVLREQIADEVADVLLYLLQIADHTAVDLKRAVGRKLVKNAKKHPPIRSGLPAGTAATSEIETHVLVDWENVQPKEGDIRSVVPDVTDIWLFHGPGQKIVGAHHASFSDRATSVKIARAGKNALDFHLSFYMGYIASRHPDARFVVISNDKGYAPMLEHAVELGFSARQVGFGPAKVPATKSASKSSPVKKSAPGKKVAAKKAAAKKAPAAKKPTGKAAVGTTKPGTPDPSATGGGAPTTAASAAKSAPGAAKASAKKSGATQKASTAKETSAPVSPTTISKPPKSKSSGDGSPIDLKKGVSHVLASLKKTTSRPTRQARLMATIKSLLGPSADEQAAHSVLSHLLASGKVAIDDKGAVRYDL